MFSVSHVLALQRTAGNRAVTRYLLRQTASAAYPGAPTKDRKAAPGEVLSTELSDAPDAATPAERVFKWLQAHAVEIAAQEAKFGVDRRAIAGAIAWEALENPRGAWGALGGRFVGAGKPHVKDSFAPAAAQTSENVPQEVEEAGLLPRRSMIGRELGLRKDSIPYIAAGMRLATDIGRAYGHDIATDPAMLTWFWQGKDANKFIAYLSTKEGNEFDTTHQDMSTWVTENLAWLESAVGRCELKPGASLPKAGTMETASWQGEYKMSGRLPETREFLVNGGRVDVTIVVDTDIVAAFGYSAYVVLHRRQQGTDVEMGERRVAIGKTSKVTWEGLTDGIYFLEIFSDNGVQVEGQLQVDLAPRRPQGRELQRQAAAEAPDAGTTTAPPDSAQLRADAARALVAQIKAKNIKYGHNWADEKHTARSDEWWWDESEFDCAKFVLWVLAGRKLGDPRPDDKQPKQVAIRDVRAGSLGAVNDASSVSAMTSIVKKLAAGGETKLIEKRAPKVGDLIFWTTHVGIVVELTAGAKGETFLIYANATRPGKDPGADLTGVNEKGQRWLKVSEIPTNSRLADGDFLGYWSP
jgi:cell wall-associated NlpC family hydrolase